MKKKSKKKLLYKKCLLLAKTIAKTRDGYVCQWCGKSKPQVKIDASHIINEARDHRLSINPDNIKALCHYCHFSLWHKDPGLAMKWFNKRFPKRWEKLQKIHIENQSLGSISELWYEEQYDKLTKQLLKMEKKSV